MDNSNCSELLAEFSDEYNELVAFGKQHGVEALDALLELLGGQKPHIPMRDNFWTGLQREIRNRSLRERFNGRNYGQLAMEEHISEREVRRIIHSEERKYAPKETAPRPMKVSASHHDRICDLAERCNLSLYDMLDSLLARVLNDESLEEDLRAEHGEQMKMVVGE